MNLKSYTRGIGAGLIVAALVLGIGNKTEKMTDAQVKTRALELGMIEAQTLTQITGDSQKNEADTVEKTDVITENETDEKEDVTPEYKEPDAVTVEPFLNESESSDETSVSTPEEVQNEDNDTEEEANDEPEIENADDSDGSEDIPVINEVPEGTVEIQIIRGDSSVTVSRKMYEAGLVESAVEFDKFLCQNGYDRYISVGTYTINVGATFEEMAKIITGK